MPVSYSYQEDGGVFITAEGSITGQDIIKLNREIYSQCDSIKYQIVDYMKCDSIDATTDEVKKIAEQDKEGAMKNPGMIIGVAANEQLAFGISRMWDSYVDMIADSVQIETSVFKSLEGCCEWIESRLENPYEIET